MNDSHFHYVDDPTVQLADDGSALVLWVDNRKKDVFFQRHSLDERTSPDSPVNVSKTPTIFSWLPRMALGSKGTLFVVWQEIVFSGGTHGGEIFFARSADAGKTFSEPRNLSNTTAGCGKGRLTRTRWHNGSLDIELGQKGELFVAWTEYEGPLRFSRSTDGGNTFSEPLHVAGDARSPARAPALAVGPQGVLHLAWALGEDPSADIHLAFSHDAGRSFQAPQVVTRTNGYSDAPKLAVDGNGSVHLVHAERQTGFFGKAQIHYVRRQATSAVFGKSRALSVLRNRRASGAGADFPSLALDAAGRVYVLWEHVPDGFEPAHGLGFTASLDGGKTFSPAVFIGDTRPAAGRNGSLQGKLMDKLAVQAGQLAAVNSRFIAGKKSLVQLFRGKL